MSGEWIGFDGDDCPVKNGLRVEVRFKDETTEVDDTPEQWSWERDLGTATIVAYRVLPEAKPTKHSHYHKDVSKYSSIDVYRVLDLFGVTDQAIGHAAKKLLVAGGRGHKDIDRDVQDVIDTLERWKEMREEDMGNE